MSIYLDYAAATPMSAESLAAMQAYFSDKFYNPSATYLASRGVREELSEWRARVANLLGARPAEIIFTSGATEANNLALKGVFGALGGKVLVSSVEHESVLAPAKSLGAEEIPVDKTGAANISWLANNLDGVSLVSLMLVNNETGTIQPVKEAAQLIEAERIKRAKTGDKLPIYLHTDAAQAANYLDLHISRLAVDLMSINGGKIFGPKASGILFVRAGVRIAPLNQGGGQEFGLRSGTESLAQVAGLVTALEMAQTVRTDCAKYVGGLRESFEQLIIKNYPDAVINGGKKRAPHICSITFPGQDNETLMFRLDEQGVQCAVGSACSASSDEPSHVLKNIGLTDAEARATLRFSFSKITTEADVEKAAKVLLAQL